MTYREDFTLPAELLEQVTERSCFAILYTPFKLECLKMRQHLNHFALRVYLNHKAIREAFDKLQTLEAA